MKVVDAALDVIRSAMQSFSWSDKFAVPKSDLSVVSAVVLSFLILVRLRILLVYSPFHLMEVMLCVAIWTPHLNYKLSSVFVLLFVHCLPLLGFDKNNYSLLLSAFFQ